MSEPEQPEQPEQPAPPPAEPELAPAPKPSPNMLHEWAAAVVVILVLSGFAYIFINMLRSARM